MKILHIINGLATGGAQRALYNLLYGGASARFECRVLSLIDEEDDQRVIGRHIGALGVPVISLGIRGGCPTFSSLIKLNKIVGEFKPDVIQGWMYHGNLIATLARKLSQVLPVLAWNVRHSLSDISYEKFMTQQVIRLNRIFSSGPDVLLYNSRLSQQQHENFGFSSINGRTIPNGIDVHKFSFSSLSRQKVRSELGIPEDALVVGHVARLHPSKDHQLLLKAAAVFARRNNNTHILLSGSGVSAANKVLIQLVPTEIQDRFHLLGEREDVPELMSAMDILVSSSAWGEGFPNVLGESMASGVPCVATDVGDSKQIVGDTGVIVPPQSEKELITGIEKLLTLSNQERQALGNKARLRIEKKYALEAIVEQYVSLYRRLVTEKRSH